MTHPFRRKNNLKRPKQRHTLYNVWIKMLYKCNSEMSKDYHLYGAKGIRVCLEWEKNYNKFLLWAVKNGYKPGLRLKRIDNTKNFEPNNCTWYQRELI